MGGLNKTDVGSEIILNCFGVKKSNTLKHRNVNRAKLSNVKKKKKKRVIFTHCPCLFFDGNETSGFEQQGILRTAVLFL